MAKYEAGFIVTRCHIQKRLKLRDGTEVIPLGATGFANDIHAARVLLGRSGFNFTRNNLSHALTNFEHLGQATLIKIHAIEATTSEKAIEIAETTIPSILGALAIVSANPVIQLCAYAKSTTDSGVKFYVPDDRKISHATNVSGFLEAFPEIEASAEL